MPQTLIEKIVQKFALDLPAAEEVHSGDYLFIRPAHVLTHDNTGAVIPKFKSIGAEKIADPRQPVFALDHDIQNQSEKNRAKYRSIEAFAKEMGVDFYPAGRGIDRTHRCGRYLGDRQNLVAGAAGGKSRIGRETAVGGNWQRCHYHALRIFQ
jgi:aconitase A